MAKVRKFEDRLKLSIRDKIIGFLLQDMDYMVRTTMVIEREIKDAQSIRDMSTSDKRKENKSSSSSRKKTKASSSQGFQGQGRGHQGQGQAKASSQAGQTTCYLCHQPGHIKRNFPQRRGSHGFGTAQSQSSMGQART